MTADTDHSTPLATVFPEYVSWLERVRQSAAKDAADADAAFAAQHGPISATQPAEKTESSLPEQPRGALADEKA
jgi:hypothetical protein